ncbi:hypothetical protein [uncultured Cyclobacterium sp.]|uniref:hypothetical protein n=1 Tax=uncultured Cyclobacterium sp. TaxID=453820 RepID=UPI0030EB340E|tara:strand:+ start:48327 stop:48983 length:657 start_codon:yes stop_codon:yes gene_type:complete
MASKPKYSEAGVLEQYRIALDNAESQPKIAAIMAELGYDAAAISEGRAILNETRQAYELNQTEDDERTAAYADFSSKKEQLEDVFSMHRKKAKVIFRKDPVTAEELAVSGAKPRAYMRWLEAVKKYYGIASTDSLIQGKLARLKISVDDLNAAKAMISDIEVARSNYLREKGESQDATKIKDAAFAKIDDWMSEFYAVAKIGLDENPQLLEALGKVVR